VSAAVLRRLLVVSTFALVGALAAGGCASSVSPAVTVDGVKVSDHDLLDEVGEWAHNPQAYPAERLETQNPGTYPMELVTAILGQRIDLMLIHAEFEHLKLRLDDDLRTQAVSALFNGDLTSAQEALSHFGKSYRDEYVDLISEQLAVQDRLGADFDTWRSSAYDKAKIDVSPKYGTWDKTTGAVNPPPGPKQPASADSELLGG
jgi:hypothetical protein